MPAWMTAQGSSSAGSAPGGLSQAAPAPAPAPTYGGGGGGGVFSQAPPPSSFGGPPPNTFAAGGAAPGGLGHSLPSHAPGGGGGGGGSGVPMHAPMPVAATKFCIDRERQWTKRKRRRATLFDVPPGEVEAIAGPDYMTGGVQPGKAAPVDSDMGGAVSMQATRHARRIYVGGVGDVTERDLHDYFNSVIDKAYKPIPGGAVLSVYKNSERRFAFVEFRTLALTTAAMALDGINYNGQPLKLRRPNDYNPDAVPASLQGEEIHLNLGSLGIVSSTVPDSPYKVFMGGLPHHLQAADIIQLLTPFGPLKGFHLVKESGAEHSKGYAFFEFADPSVTQDACEGLNGLQLGDRALTVRMAMNSQYAHNMTVPQVAGGSNAVPLGGGGGGAPGAPPLQGQGGPPPAQAPAPAGAQVAPTRPVSRVLRLSNMVTQEDLGDDAEFADIKADIQQEAAKFGAVADVIMPRHGAPGTGQVFIVYAEPSAAAAAARDMAGRAFAGRTVCAEFLNEDAFAAGRLD